MLSFISGVAGLCIIAGVLAIAMCFINNGSPSGLLLGVLGIIIGLGGLFWKGQVEEEFKEDFKVKSTIRPHKKGKYAIQTDISTPNKFPFIGSIYSFASLSSPDSIEIVKIRDSLYCISKISEFRRLKIDNGDIPRSYSTYETSSDELAEEEKMRRLTHNSGHGQSSIIPVFIPSSK